MNAFYNQCHFILRWIPWTLVVSTVILYTLVGLSRILYIEIDSLSNTWIPGCNMEDRLKAYYMWRFRDTRCIEILIFLLPKKVYHTHLWTYSRKWKHWFSTLIRCYRMERKSSAGSRNPCSSVKMQHSTSMARWICVATSPHCGQIQNHLLLCGNACFSGLK